MSTNCMWFVVPKDGDTNEIIARFLSQIGDGSGCEFAFTDDQGIERQSWRVEYPIITRLVRNTEKFKLKFDVFSKEGGGAYKQNFLHLKKRKSAKAKKMEAEAKSAKLKK